MTSPDDADAMAEALDARVHLIPAAGHLSAVENPDAVAAVIREAISP